MIYCDDCLNVLPDFDDNSIDSMVTDPPAGISFMGKKWDTGHLFTETMICIFEECFRVLKPGAHTLVWGIPRTSHKTTIALEEVGFEIRDIITHLFGSGFPKSKNLGDGWGTALKPAAEFWILVRKPLSEKTITKNVLVHGTGGINVDESRVEHSSDNDRKNATPQGKVIRNNFAPGGNIVGTETNRPDISKGRSGLCALCAISIFLASLTMQPVAINVVCCKRDAYEHIHCKFGANRFCNG